MQVPEVSSFSRPHAQAAPGLPKSGCVFCAGGLFRANHGHSLPAEAIRLEPAGVSGFVIVDVAPVVEGHLLFVSRGHYRSMRDTGVDLGALLDQLSSWASRVWGDGEPVLIEHGTGPLTESGCVEHAHVHVLPATTEARVWSRLDEIEIRKSERCEPEAPLGGYLAVHSKQRTTVIHDSGLPRQIARYLAAPAGIDYRWQSALGGPDSRSAMLSTSNRLLRCGRALNMPGEHRCA